MPKPRACRKCASCNDNCKPNSLIEALEKPKKELSKMDEALIEASRAGYEVMDDGQVIAPSGRYRTLCGKIRGQGRTAQYLYFTITTGSREDNTRATRTVMVHRLSAYQKFGDDMFREGVQVRHLDNNEQNNAPANLCLGTGSVNMMDRPPEVRSAHAGKAHRKYTDEQIVEMVEMHKAGKTYKEIMARFGIKSKGTVSYIMNNSMASEEARGGESLGHKPAYTPEQEAEVVRMYLAGEQMRVIREKFGMRSNGSIASILKRHGIKSNRRKK